jgi:hypothetical protein
VTATKVQQQKWKNDDVDQDDLNIAIDDFPLDGV